MSPIAQRSGYAVRNSGPQIPHTETEQIVDIGHVAHFADGALEPGDVGELVDLAAECDHAAIGADLDAGREVAETQRKSDAHAIRKGLVPACRR